MPTFRNNDLRIGAMRQRVTIQRIVTQDEGEEYDEAGQPVVEWEDWLTNEPAEYVPTGGTESLRGRQIEANVKGIFRVRYRAGYSTEMKVVYNGTSYGILYANPVDGGRRFIELFVVASGAV